jgi:acyl-CoA thioesterase FadM
VAAAGAGRVEPGGIIRPAMDGAGGLETYRGTVYCWELDGNEHLTVAYYFSRIADAGLAFLEAIGLGPSYTGREQRALVTADCYVRYTRELRAGDIAHMTTGVIRVEAAGLLLGHELVDSETGEVCTTIEQQLRHVDADGRTPVPLAPLQQQAAETRRVVWNGPPRERRPQPRALDGFRDSARDTVKPNELDVLGQLALSSYIHRFSAANGHALAALGITPGYLRRERRGFSTFEFQLAFTGMLRPGDPVAVRSALVHLGTSSLRLFHVMSNERTGERVARLEQFGVHLDLDARRPAAVPDAVREAARAMLVATA